MLITFKFKKKEFYLILASTFLLLLNIIIKEKRKSNLDLIHSLSQICMIILYFIEKQLSKIKSNEIIKIFVDVVSKKEENRLKKKNSYIKKGIFICLIIFFIIYCFVNQMIIMDAPRKILIDYTKLLNIYFLDSLCFQKNVYPHHIFSIIIVFIIILILILTQISKIQYKIMNLFISNYCDTFKLLLTKYLYNRFYVSIYLTDSILGLTKFFFYVKDFDKTYDIYYKSLKFLPCFIIFIEYFLNCALNNFILIKLGAIHLFLIEFIDLNIIVLINNSINDSSLLVIILIIISILSGLIYLEMIQLRFWGLDYGLKDEIIKRGEKEFQLNESSIFYDSQNNE